MLATATADHSLDWEECLPKVCFAYNTSVQASTGHTPFYLMFGRQAKLLVGLMYSLENTQEVDLPEYIANLKRTFQKAYEIAREHIGEKQQFQKELYNQKVHGLPFCIGDLVWLYVPAVTKGRLKKLHLPWDGPYRVIKRLSDVNYCIQATMGRRRRLVVHFNRLKKCSSVMEAHDSRTGNEDLSTDKEPQEPTKLPVPPDRVLMLVDDEEGDEMVAPQGERLPDAQPPRQEAVDLPQAEDIRPQEIQEELLSDAQPPHADRRQ